MRNFNNNNNNNKNNRPRPYREREFKGYYVDVTQSGGDALRAYRKLKRMYKETNYFEEMRDRVYYRKPSEIKRETKKNKQKILRRLQRDRDDMFMGIRRKK